MGDVRCCCCCLGESIPDEVTATLASLTDAVDCDCSDLEVPFVLQRTGVGATCEWYGSFPSAGCGGISIRVTLYKNSGDNHWRVAAYVLINGKAISYRVDLGEGRPQCDVLDGLSVAYIGEDTWSFSTRCTGEASSLTLSL
jgi:hypothetical protein